MAGTTTLQHSAHAFQRALPYKSDCLRNGTRERRVDAFHPLVFANSMRAGIHRLFPRVYRQRR